MIERNDDFFEGTIPPDTCVAVEKRDVSTALQRCCRYNNEHVRKIFAGVQENPGSPQAQIAWLVASIRWLGLRATFPEVRRQVGLKNETSKGIENTKTVRDSFDRKSMHALRQFWAQNNVPYSAEEQLLSLINQREGGGITGFVSSASCEVPKKQFDSAKGFLLAHVRMNRNGTPPYGKLQEWVNTWYTGNSKEEIAKRQTRMSQAHTAWSESQYDEYIRRTIEKPMADFLVKFEIYCAQQNIQFTGEEIYARFPITHDEAFALVRGDMVTWETIEPIYLDMLDAELDKYDIEDEEFCEEFLYEKSSELGEQWQEMEAIENQRVTFWKKCRSVQYEQNLPSQYLGNSLGIKQKRGKNFCSHGQEISRVLSGESIRFCSSVPPACLLELLEDVNGTLHTELYDLYEQDRRRDYRRTGDLKMLSERIPLRIKREWYGISPIALAEYLHSIRSQISRNNPRDTAAWIHQIEMTDATLSRADYRMLENAIVRIGKQKIKDTIERKNTYGSMPESCKKFSVIADGVGALITFAGGTTPLWEDSGRAIGRDIILAISKGVYPPLTDIRNLFDVYNIELTHDAEKDWHKQYVVQITEGKTKHSFTSSLSRMLYTCISKDYSTITSFATQCLRGPECHRDVITLLKRIDTDNQISSGPIKEILLALNISPDSHIWEFALLLQNCSPEEAMKCVRRKRKWKHLEIHPIYFPGCTSKELGITADTNTHE